ncbi:MAG: hypothetical protein Q9226_004400 [Calogaya cf. arnoldii]
MANSTWLRTQRRELSDLWNRVEQQSKHYSKYLKNTSFHVGGKGLLRRIKSRMTKPKTQPPFLPAELRLCILESCEDVDTARHLACTSRAYRSTWLAFKDVICEPILRRTVPCYDVAQRLAKVEQENETLPPYERYLAIVLGNAQRVEKACKNFRDWVIGSYRSGKTELVTTTEHNRFFRALYNWRTLAVMQILASNSNKRLPLEATLEFVKGISIIDFCIFWELTRIIIVRMENCDRPEIGLTRALNAFAAATM